MTYRTAGQGPPLLLLHGVTTSSQTWESVASPLSERFTLIAPDLLGHGASATPARRLFARRPCERRARDLLTALGHEHVTVRSIVVPFRRPLRTKVGDFSQWPLLVVDITREHVVGARKCRGSQDEVHVAPQTSAGDEHEAGRTARETR